MNSSTPNQQPIDSLAAYYADPSFALYARSKPDRKWGDLKKGKAFLERYGISETAYETRWGPLQQRLFRAINKLGYDVRFRPDFAKIPLDGGVLFEAEEYRQLQAFMREIGDERLLIVQNPLPKTDAPAPFRLELPISLSWEALFEAGDYMASVLFEMPHNEYFVFSESGRWGKYAANDYAEPVDIYGIHSAVLTNFIDCFWPRLSSAPLPATADK